MKLLPAGIQVSPQWHVDLSLVKEAAKRFPPK